MSALSRLARLLGSTRWLSALRESNPDLADDIVRAKGSDARADAFLEELHVMTMRYLRGSTRDLSEAELNERAWAETVAGLAAQLVPRQRPGE